MTIRYFTLLIFFYTQYSYAGFMDWLNGLVKCAGGVYINHTAEPVLTANSGGSNSVSKVQIKVKYDGCFFIVGNFTGELLLDVNFIDSMHGFAYTALYNVDDSVCENKCVYGIKESDPDRLIKCPDNDTNKGGELAHDWDGETCVLPKNSPFSTCDTSITLQYLKLCEVLNNKAPGICGYHSSLPTLVTAVENALANIGNSVFMFSPIGLISLAATGNLNNNPVAVPNFTLIKCFPMPVHGLPPPFCDWKNAEIIPPTPSRYNDKTFVVPKVEFCQNTVNSLAEGVCMKVSSEDLGMIYDSPKPNLKECSISISPNGNITSDNCSLQDKLKNKNTLSLAPFVCPSTNIQNPPPPPLLEDNYKICLSGIPKSLKTSDIKKITPYTAITPYAANGITVPTCESLDEAKQYWCSSCDISLCVDMYPFKFECANAKETVKKSDGSTTEINLSARCETEIYSFCTDRKDNNREYTNFDTCINNQYACYKNNKATVAFGDKNWKCSTVNKILTNFDSKYLRYDFIEPKKP